MGGLWSHPAATAIRAGDLQALRTHVDADTVNTPLSDGQYLLHVAARVGNSDATQLLVDLGATVDAYDDRGYSPLELAAAAGFTHILDILLPALFRLSHSTVHLLLQKAFSQAAMQGHKHAVQLLGSSAMPCSRPPSGLGLLASAVKHEDTTLLSRLCDALPRHTADYGLLCACGEGGAPAAVGVLLARGVDVNVQAVDGATPLTVACLGGRGETVGLLVQAGADVNKSGANGRTALWMAALAGHASVVAYLIERGAVVDKPSESGATPFIIACRRDKLDCAALLLRAGADVNHQEQSGDSALMSCCRRARVAGVRWLLEHGADLTLRDTMDAHALTLAISAGSAQAVRLLIEAGADVNAKQRRVKYPMLVAIKCGDVAIMRALLDAGADLQLCIDSGTSPFSVLAKNVAEVLEVLLEQGLSPYGTEADRQTPMTFTSINSRPAAIKVLFRYGFDPDWRGHVCSAAAALSHDSSAAALSRDSLPCSDVKRHTTTACTAMPACGPSLKLAVTPTRTPPSTAAPACTTAQRNCAGMRCLPSSRLVAT
eukprot:PLAT13977.3.p1 GENE.PLAT13977.3~~PLAT13977.3.p1  ORF type:complete len:553 (-),score=131.28 PLAT13977.3:307-1941(-)